MEISEDSIAPCGHPERFWKVEVNQDAWCLQCAVEKLAIENNALQMKLSLRDYKYVELASLNDRFKKRLELATRFLKFQLVHEYDIDEYNIVHKQMCRKCEADKILEEMNEIK